MNEGRIDSFSLKIIQFFSNKQIFFVTSFVEHKFSHLGSTAPCSTTEKLLVSTADSFAASFAGAPASSSKRTHTTTHSGAKKCSVFIRKSTLFFGIDRHTRYLWRSVRRNTQHIYRMLKIKIESILISLYIHGIFVLTLLTGCFKNFKNRF